MASQLDERYDERIAGVLSCYDRTVVTGTLPMVCYAQGMTRFLFANEIRIFDYPKFALKLRDRVRARASELAAQAGVEIEHIAKSHVRKEEVVAEVLGRRGEHPGLVHVISAMEACNLLPALARQDDAQQLRASGQRQVPALLFLLSSSALAALMSFSTLRPLWLERLS